MEILWIPFGWWQKLEDKISEYAFPKQCAPVAEDSGLGVFWVACTLSKVSSFACKYSKSRKSRGKDLNTRNGQRVVKRREDL